MRDKLRLLHILESINYLESFLQNKEKDHLYNEPILRFAVERQLEIIGEAAKHLSEETKDKSGFKDWSKVIAFRNFIAHEYFGVDLDLIWSITQKNIPELKIVVSNLLI